ncbi:MAG TPA: hypothetical protein VHY84_27485 [Bryobacteraceae bacterium]|jgi:hypothetical protein|nr:hypothetical protein [Bryobacteraceae bacterium]
MTEAEFKRDDHEYERQLERREELEREDISLAHIANFWARSQRIAVQSARTPRAIEEGVA